MKHEILGAPEIDAFARARAQGQGDTSEGQLEPEPFDWIGGGELTQMKPRKKQMVVERILPAGGLTVIASKSKSGKTTLMVELCHAVSTGRPALGHYKALQGPVLYWLADDSNIERFAESWRIVSGDVNVDDFHLCVKRQHLYPEGIINLRKAAEKYRPILIGVDSYTTIRTPRTRNTDFVKAEYDDMRHLSELAAETGAAITLIHHQSKTKQADPFDAVAGSYAMSAGADGRVVVEKLQESARLVRLDGRDLDAFEFVYTRGEDRRLLQVIDGPAAVHWERLHKIAAKHGGLPFTTKDVGETFGLGDRQARRILNEWEQIAALNEFERGRYILQANIVEAAGRIGKVAAK